MVKYHVGIDVHRRSWTVTILSQGEVLFRGNISPSPKVLVEVLGKRGVHALNSRIVYEIGPSGFWLYDALHALGFDVIVVAPAKIPRDPSSRVKTDARDSMEIARLLQAGLLTSIHIPTPEERSFRDLVRTRKRLIQDRAGIMRSVKSKLTFVGLDYDNRGWSMAFKAWIRQQSLLEGHRQAIEAMLMMGDVLSDEIERLEKEMVDAMEKCVFPERRLYASVPSFGLVTIAVLISELGDLSRFKSAEHLVSYIGLNPSEYSSGETIRRGRITQRGNVHVRTTLVEAAWRLIQKDPAMKKFFLRISRGQHGKKAIVAVARKLATILWTMFRTGELYRQNKAA